MASNDNGQIDELRAIRSRELNLKRSQGAIACAECRRLKLKCDRKVPCLTCKRRGCENICPTGVSERVRREARRRVRAPRVVQPRLRAAGPSSQAQSPSVTESSQPDWRSTLFSKLIAMSGRIRALEDALQQEYSLHQALRQIIFSRMPNFTDKGGQLRGRSEKDKADSRKGKSRQEAGPSEHHPMDPTHPLLALDLLEMKNGIEVYTSYLNDNNDSGAISGPEDGSTSEMIDAFGMLTVQDGQRVGFSGASAPENSLLMAISDKEKNSSSDPSAEDEQNPIHLPAEVTQANARWPFPPSTLPTSLAAELVMHLPTLDRAMALIEAYFSTFAWDCTPLERTQASDELLPLFYPSDDHALTYPANLVATVGEHPQELALLFALLGCGVSASFDLASEDRGARLFAELTKAAFSLRSFLQDGSVIACQALLLLDALESRVYERPSRHTPQLRCVALALASNSGLNRDPERLNLPCEIAQRRRHFFWEVYAADLWRSLTSGRAPTFALNSIDVKFPNLPRDFVGADGEETISVQEWRYRFARDVLSHVAEKMTSPRPMKYSEILELDKRIRTFGPHPFALRPMPQEYADWKPSYFCMHPGVTAWYLESILLLIHRNFFVRAMIDFPDDPMQSVFAPSIIASYRSASYIIRLYSKSYHSQVPRLNRIWFMWAKCISCSMILATIAAKGHALNFSMAAFNDLELSMEMYSKFSNPVVKHGLVFLKKLRDRAYDVLFNSPETNPDHAARCRTRNATDAKSSSRIVSSHLFQDLIMAKFIGSNQDNDPEAAGSAGPRGLLNGENGDQSLSVPLAWADASNAPEVQALSNSQVAFQTLSSSTEVEHDQVPSESVDDSTLFIPTSLAWETSQPRPSAFIGDSGAFFPDLSSAFDVGSGSSTLAETARALDLDYSASTDTDMNARLDGGTDWLSFMQLAGVYGPESDIGAGAGRGTGFDTDWEGNGFS